MAPVGGTERAMLAAEVQEALNHCNRCGFCLPACPTYGVTHSEVASPRGRLAIVDAFAKGQLADEAGMEEALSLCLGCRACEPVCPAGVAYHRVLQAVRSWLNHLPQPRRRQGWAVRLVRWLAEHPRWLRWGAVMARPLHPLLARLGRRNLRWQMAVGGLAPTPRVPGKAMRERREASGMPVWLFPTCVAPAAFPAAVPAAVRLLTAAGAQVTVAPGQGCCGALRWHLGDRGGAATLAKRNLAAWRSIPADALLVVLGGGCGAAIGEYAALPLEGQWRRAAEARARQVVDFAEALVRLPRRLRWQGRGERIGLHQSCHLLHGMGQGAATVRLLSDVAGDRWVALPGQDRCCGSAGTYSYGHPEMAWRILHQHLEEVADAGLDRWLTNNPGCTMFCRWGAARLRLGVRVEHVAEYLYERWTGEVE